MSNERSVKIVAMVVESDDTVELHDRGRLIGRYTRLDKKQARLERGARELLSSDLAVAAFISARCRSHGMARLTDPKIAAACKLSVAAVYRSRLRLRSAGLLSWQRTRRASIYRMVGRL
jgi:hypothetical protein